MPNYLDNLSFYNLKLKLGPDFKIQYSQIVQAYLDTKLDLNINGAVGDDLMPEVLFILKKVLQTSIQHLLDLTKIRIIIFYSLQEVV